jgi:hypothetical protein
MRDPGHLPPSLPPSLPHLRTGLTQVGRADEEVVAAVPRSDQVLIQDGEAAHAGEDEVLEELGPCGT